MAARAKPSVDAEGGTGAGAANCRSQAPRTGVGRLPAKEKRRPGGPNGAGRAGGTGGGRRRNPERSEERPDRDYLEALSRRVMAGGLSWAVIEARWPAMREAMADFDPDVVASLDGHALDRLMTAPGILHNAAKLEAVVSNAEALVELSREHGSFGGWLREWRERTWEERAAALCERFQLVGERTAWRFLEEVGEPVPHPPPWEG